MSQHSELFAHGLYLTRVSFSEEKKEVLVDFSNEKTKLAKRFKFFPFVVLPAYVKEDKLSELLLDFGIKGFELKQEGGRLIVFASSLAELKRISNALSVALHEKPLVLEPERQFLLEKNWSYFDTFEVIDFCGEEVVAKVGGVGGAEESLIQKEFGFFLTKEIPFGQALKLSESNVLFLVEQASWSSLLSVPIDKVPDNIQNKTELLLENLFFKNGSSISWKKQKEFFVSSEYAPLGLFDSVSSIDFSFVWAQLFAKSFFNLGVETANCNCCAPITLHDKNLYASSLIEVQFNEDNFYFESSSHSFSQNFHRASPFKDNRLAKRKEFFLKSYPIGPFFRGDKAKLPLIDAKKLLVEEKVELLPGGSTNHELEWFCTKKESFLANELGLALGAIKRLNNYLNSFQQSLFTEKSFGYYFACKQLTALNSLVAEVPFQLMNTNSKFFSLPLARNILAVQEATMHRFKEFSEQNGYRVLHSNNRSAFIKGFSSLRLAKGFAKASSLPQPAIRAFSKGAKISQMA